MKKIFLILIVSVSLFAAAPFTLDNLKSLRIYIVNKSNFINKQQAAEIKEVVAKKLNSAGITLNAIDSPTFMVKIDSIEVGEIFVVNVSIGIGEEIITKRKDAIQTLAFTYYANDLLKTDEPYAETLESVHYLVDEFVELYNEDKE